MFDRGFLRLGSVRGVPLRVHWSLPIGMLLLAGFSPVAWLAFIVIVLLHEAGHAMLVRRYGLHVEAIDLTGFGGVTRWTGATTPRQRSVIAWGGVAAQAVLLAVTGAVVLAVGWPTSWAGYSLAHAFTRTNFIIMAINLLPFEPLDGAEAWKLFSGTGLGGPRRWRLGPR